MSSKIGVNIQIIISFFGFISGFLLLITGNTLNFWIAKEGLSPDKIGLFSLVCFPYAINFVWAPLLDRITLDFIKVSLDFRIKWLLLLHASGFLTCIIISQVGVGNLLPICFLSLLLSFINSSQDIVLSAYRAEYIPKSYIASSSGLYIFGYRMGMIATGPLAIYASKYSSFELQYIIFGLFYVVFATILILIDYTKRRDAGSGAQESKIYYLSQMFKNIGSTNLILYILAFLVLYKIGDNLIGAMINYYLIHLGFQEDQIAIAGKLSGILGSAAGGIIASHLMNHNNITESLVRFGIWHAAAHGGYIILSRLDNSSIWLFIVTIIDSVTSGMSMSCYIALITSLCSGRFKTTQYAVFSSMMGISRAIFPSISGFVVLICGWDMFFAISIFMIIPPLILLKKIEYLKSKASKW